MNNCGAYSQSKNGASSKKVRPFFKKQTYRNPRALLDLNWREAKKEDFGTTSFLGAFRVTKDLEYENVTKVEQLPSEVTPNTIQQLNSTNPKLSVGYNLWKPIKDYEDYLNIKQNYFFKWLVDHPLSLQVSDSFVSSIDHLLGVLVTPYNFSRTWTLFATKFKGKIFLNGYLMDTESSETSDPEEEPDSKDLMVTKKAVDTKELVDIKEAAGTKEVTALEGLEDSVEVKDTLNDVRASTCIRAYLGFKFIELVTNESREYNAAKFFAVQETRFRNFNLVMTTEMHATKMGHRNLKSPQFIDIKHTRSMHAKIYWWARTTLGRLNEIVIGKTKYWDILDSVSVLKADDLLVLDYGEEWKPELCLDYLARVLNFVLKNVKEDNPNMVHVFTQNPDRLQDPVFEGICEPLSDFPVIPAWFPEAFSKTVK